VSATLVDSNVLLDIATEDPTWYEWSADALANAVNHGPLIINAIIYAEVSAGYSRMEDLDARLPKTVFEREPIPYEAAFLAGQSFLIYRRRGGTKRSPLPERPQHLEHARHRRPVDDGA